MISRSSVDNVTEAASARIVDIVGDYVQLRRRGASYMGCCPFHSEKTPSFSVSPAKGYCYCFGCHKGGSAVNFIMEVEKLSFPDAIRFLGQRLGVEVVEEQRTDEQARQKAETDALNAANEYAAKFYQRALTHTEEGKTLGLSYFRHRGFRDDTIALYRLGYASADRDALLRQATADGFKQEVLVKAGLLTGDVTPDGSTPDGENRQDRFRSRVMFPIFSHNGKVIGFGGRLLDARTKGVAVKYLNTPETALYVKGDTLYGLFQARTDISREDKCLLVEGYTDVLSMHQAGLRNVVASSGTALTVNQIRLIHRFTANLTVLYDGDAAGQHAAMRGIDLILAEGMNVRVAALPPEEDPDTFARKHPEAEIRAFLAQAETDFISYKVRSLQAAAEGDPQALAQTAESLVTSIACVPDELRREIYVKECAQVLGLSAASLTASLQKALLAQAQAAREQQEAWQRRRERERTAQTANQGLRPGAGTAGQGASSGTVPTPAGAARVGGKLEDVEYRELMRLLVTYTQVVLDRVEGQPTVGDYIAAALAADDLRSREPHLEALYYLYQQAPDRTALTFNSFLGVEDVEAGAFVAGTVAGRQPLSRIHSKYAQVESEEQLLNTLVPRACDELRLRRVVEMIDETMRGLTAAKPEEVQDLMQQLMDLNQIKQELSREMGERAVVK